MLRQIFKKSLYYFATLVGGKLLSAVFFIVVARMLLPEKFGLITLFMTVVQIVTVLADVGIKQWYQKKMAEKKQPLLFSQIFSWRLIYYCLSVIILGAIEFLTGIFGAEMLTFMIVALLLEGLISVADAYYLARGESLKLGYKLIARNLLLFGSLFFMRGPETYQYFYYFYNLALVGVMVFYFPWRHLDWRWLRYGWGRGKGAGKGGGEKIRTALPYAAIDDLGIIYSRADSLIIEQLRGVSELGIYSAAYRYLDAFNLIPQALFHNLFPLAAREGNVKKRQIAKMVAVMSALGLIVGAGMFLASDFLITFLMGPAYAAAAEVLRYFSVVIVLFFFNAPLNTIIQSSKRVKSYVPWLGGVVGLNIVLNLLLVPRLGNMGAVYTMMICEGLLILINLGLVRWIYKR